MIDIVWIYLAIIIYHWIADFILQTSDMALNKSTSNKWLTMHVLSYTGATCLCWFLMIYFIGLDVRVDDFFIGMLFIGICHWVTDYYTSRLNSKYWKEKKTHEFFVSIGFDQVLHYIQLFLIFKTMIK